MPKARGGKNTIYSTVRTLPQFSNFGNAYLKAYAEEAKEISSLSNQSLRARARNMIIKIGESGADANVSDEMAHASLSLAELRFRGRNGDHSARVSLITLDRLIDRYDIYNL